MAATLPMPLLPEDPAPDAPMPEGMTPFDEPTDAETSLLAAPAPLSPQDALTQALSESEILEICMQYKREAVDGRSGGDTPRDTVWERNLDMYWMRHDDSGKEDWQHREVSARGKKAVDRFAAGMRKAVMRPGEDWYAIGGPFEEVDAMGPMIRRITDEGLARSGTTANGHVAGFPFTFGRAMKIGALMEAVLAVTWSEYENRMRIDTVDPREVYLDPKGRGLYRLRSREIDRYEFESMPNLIPGAAERVGDWGGHRREEEHNRATGHTEGGRPNGRRVVLLDEFYFSCLLDQNGNKVAEDVIIMIANESVVARGPELNPNWHGSDHLIVHSLIDAPLSIYGMTYAEDFYSTWWTITRYQQLLMDGATLETLANYMVHPEYLRDPSQVNEGVRPFKMWLANTMAPPGQQVFEKIDLGSLPTMSMDVLQALLGELREATGQNEIKLGQLPGKGERTATEISETSQAGDELQQDIAEGIDAGLLSPTLRLAWYTMIQHVDPTRPEVMRAFGGPVASMLAQRRDEFRERAFNFRASAISALATRNARARGALAALQTIAQSPILAAAFLQDHSMKALLADVWRNWGLDATQYRRGPSDPPPPQIAVSPQGGVAGAAPPGAAKPPAGAPDAG